MSAVSWSLQLAVRDGQIETFRALMAEMVVSTRSEAGSQIYEWFITDDGSACHINERYRDSDAILEHLGNFGERFMDRFLACAEPTAFFVYGDPTPAARAALDGFGAKYMGALGGYRQ